MSFEVNFAEYALPLSALAKPHVQRLVERARIVWGWDLANEFPRLLVGRQFLEDLANGRGAEFDCRLAFATPQNIDDPYLQHLTAPIALIFAFDGSDAARSELAEQIVRLRPEAR